MSSVFALSLAYLDNKIQKMESNRLIEILDRMEELQREFYSELRIQLTGVKPLPSPPAKIDERPMDRLAVQEYLGIGKTTYYCKVREGKLKPRLWPGGHKYFKSDLLDEHNESIRRGRI